MRGSRWLMPLVVATLTLAVAPHLPAQARVTGTVHDTAGAPIADVGVLLLPGGRHARTDSSGRFRFDSVARAPYKLYVRRLGYLPEDLALTVGGDTALALRMLRRPRLLDTVHVSARGCSKIYFDGFLCRQRTTHGVFLTEADLLEKNPRFLADIFQGMDGFHVEAVPTPYGPSRRVRTTQSRCLVTLYNGRQSVYTGQLDSPPDAVGGASSDRAYDESDYMMPRDLIGVEIYPPGYATPVEYGEIARGQRGDARAIAGSPYKGQTRKVERPTEKCVLVNYWTTAALRKPGGGGLRGALKRIF